MSRFRYLLRTVRPGWNFILAAAATFCLNYTLREAAGFNVWVVFAITVVVGGWLGTLAGAADAEEHDKRLQAARAVWQARFLAAYEAMGYRKLGEHKDDIQGS